jgi:hypothetical protein
MSAYEPPIETVPEFDVLLFRQDDTPLTIGTASKLFLRFPNAQGEENLAKTNVSGLLTANGGIKTASIEPINPALNPAITIGSTLVAGGSASIKIGTTAATTTVDMANMSFYGGVLRFNGTGSITNSGSTNSMAFADNTVSGTINIAPSSTSGVINIGTANNRTGVVNIATGAGTHTGSVNILSTASTGGLNVNGGSGGWNSSGNLNLTGGSGATVVTNLMTRTNARCAIAPNQTNGSLNIGTANRVYTDATSMGEFNIATGTATGSGGNGCFLNIGTGARTVNSDINIGTGLRDSTSHLYIGYCDATGVNAGVFHLQDGDQNAANIHIGNGVSQTGNIQIGNGTSNSGNCNILTGASNSGDVNISTGATSTGDVFIGNNANAAGVLQLNSRNIDIGTNGATNTVIALNNPLQPNYTGTQPTTIGATAIGYQLLSSDTSPFVTPGSTPADLHSVAIGNGVWFVEGTWSMNYTVAGASNAWVRIGLNTVSATISSSRSVDYNVSTVNGDILFKVDSIFTISGGSSTMYLIGGSGGGTKATTYANIRLTRLA